VPSADTAGEIHDQIPLVPVVLLVLVVRVGHRREIYR